MKLNIADIAFIKKYLKSSQSVRPGSKILAKVYSEPGWEQIFFSRLCHRHYCIISTSYRWSQLSESVCNSVFSLWSVFFLSLTADHDTCRKSTRCVRLTAKHPLPLSPSITVKWLNVLLPGQALSAIWITVPYRLDHAQSTQIWVKEHASHKHT